MVESKIQSGQPKWMLHCLFFFYIQNIHKIEVDWNEIKSEYEYDSICVTDFACQNKAKKKIVRRL